MEIASALARPLRGLAGRLELGASRKFLSGPTPSDQEALGNEFPELLNLSKIVPKSSNTDQNCSNSLQHLSKIT